MRAYRVYVKGDNYAHIAPDEALTMDKMIDILETRLSDLDPDGGTLDIEIGAVEITQERYDGLPTRNEV